MPRRSLLGLWIVFGVLGALQLDGAEERRASSAPRLRGSLLIAGMTEEEAASHEAGPSVGSSSDSAAFEPLSRIIAGDRQNEQEPQIFMCMECTATICQDCIAKLVGGSQLSAISCPYCREHGSFRAFKTTYDFWRSTGYKKYLQDYLEERRVTIDEECHYYECHICCEQHLIPGADEPGDPKMLTGSHVEAERRETARTTVGDFLDMEFQPILTRVTELAEYLQDNLRSQVKIKTWIVNLVAEYDELVEANAKLKYKNGKLLKECVALKKKWKEKRERYRLRISRLIVGCQELMKAKEKLKSENKMLLKEERAMKTEWSGERDVYLRRIRQLMEKYEEVA